MPFGVIGGRSGLALEVRLQLDLLLEGVLPGELQGPLRQRVGSWRPRRQSLGEGMRRSREIRGGNDPGDEPEPLRVRRGQRLGEERQLGRLRRADEPRQEPRRPRVGDEADAAEGQQERRGVGGDPDVAGERERRARPGGDPVDGRDDRLRQPPHREQQRVVPGADLVREGQRVRLEPLPEVLARAEGPAGTGQDDGADGVVAREARRRPRGAPP